MMELRSALVLFSAFWGLGSVALVASDTVATLNAIVVSPEVKFCDQRLKSNFTAANTRLLLSSIEKVELKEFDYVYDQFFNPVFGRRQLGIVAQELKSVLPRAVGVVPKRAIGQADDEEPTILEDVHVLNSESLFMANVGATQELSRVQRVLQKTVDQLVDNKLNEAGVVQAAQAEVAQLKLQQVELETIAKQAHERSAGVASVSKTLEQMSIDRDSARAEQAGLASRVDRLQELLAAEAKEQGALHRDAVAERVKIQAVTDNLADKQSALAVEVKAREAKITALAEQNKALQEQDKMLLAQVEKLKNKVEEVENTLLAELEVLRDAMDKQAGEEVIEQRRIAEASVALEKAKTESERLRQEEARKTAKANAALEAERDMRQDSAARTRLEAEVALKEQSAARLSEAEHIAELEALKAKAAIARESVAAEQEAETKRERENHDVRAAMERVKAEEARAHAASVIRVVAAEAVSAVQLLAANPEQVLGAVAVLVLLAFGVYAAREGIILWRSYWQKRLGQPSLVRESSLGNCRSGFMGRVRTTLGSVQSFFVQKVPELVRKLFLPPLLPEDAEQLAREKREARKAEASFLNATKDVVLPANKALQINRIARSTRSAHKDNTPLRHVLLYGPPGTGKTMVCRHLARWCGLNYAIMSGADVAPLKDKAVTELHTLFAWAKRSERGLLLFIDEADAFLASRDRAGGMSESLRNALTALLFHTGSASSKIMLVLATNRPGDLDRAVLDRIDESVQFLLPGDHQRVLLLTQYFDTFVKPVITANSEVSDKALHDVANKTDGFSGREIAKLMSSVRAHLYGREQQAEEVEETESMQGDSDGLRLTLSFFHRIVRDAVDEHRKLESMHHEVDYDAVFRTAGDSSRRHRSFSVGGDRASPRSPARLNKGISQAN